MYSLNLSFLWNSAISYDNCSLLLLSGVGVNLRPLNKTDISDFDNFRPERLNILTVFLPFVVSARLAFSKLVSLYLCCLPKNHHHYPKAKLLVIYFFDYCFIVKGFNGTSTLVGHFVSSPRGREKRGRKRS